MSQVSVVICCYNSRLFLKETLDSLVRQNYIGFQLIFIDDGSTDDSCSIALNYKNKFRDLTIIQHQNKGLNESRNIGLQRAIGARRTLRLRSLKMAGTAAAMSRSAMKRASITLLIVPRI